MAEVVERFVADFHNLGGVTVAQKKRQLIQLFFKNSPSLQDEIILDAVTSRLAPNTHLERLFFVDFLIYHRRFEELSKQFFKGDDIIVSKISKERWFFQKAFEQIGTEFVHRVLPTLSFSLRLKVLKKLVLVLTESQSDEIFDALHSRYGLFMATNILTSCSSAKIEQILKNYPVKLWFSQLKLLYKKNPDLMFVYFEERVRDEGNAKFLNHDPIFSFIAANDPDMYCKLQAKYKFQYCRIGKRTTKKIVKAKRDDIIAKPESYAHNLKANCLVRGLGPDFKSVYFKLFPRKISDLFNSYRLPCRLLRCYPKKGQFALFQNTFDQIFQRKLELRSDLINNTLLDMIADADQREKWARLKLEHNENDNFLKYLKAENCMTAITDKFNSAGQADSRVANIGLITETCLINRDWNRLVTVCDLLCTRFKNDDKGVHIKFLQTITAHNYKFVFDNLQQIHWNYIKTIISRREIKILQHFKTAPLIFKYMEFLHKAGTPLEAEFVSVVKGSNCIDDIFLNPSNCLGQILNAECKKEVLLLLIRTAPEMIQEVDKLRKADLQLIFCCSSNISMIFDHARLLATLKNTLVDAKLVQERHIFVSVIQKLICTENRNRNVQELSELYWDNFDQFPREGIIEWFLRHHPQVIVDRLEAIFAVTFGGPAFTYYYCPSTTIKQICRIIKCYTHLGLDQKLIQFCTAKYNDEHFTKKLSLFEPLSLLMPAEDFANFIETCKPNSFDVDFMDKEESAQFLIRRYLLKSIVNTDAPETMLPVLLEFCVGDYVGSCRSPLYSCLYRTPECRIQPYLAKLCTAGAVSVKKHGFFLSCVVFDDATVLHSLKSCHLSQSIAMAYQHFVKNPSETAWQLFKTKLSKLDKNDHFTSLALVNRPAPKKYKSRCFTAVFEVFKRQNNKFTNVLLDKLQKETVAELDKEFFSTVKADFLVFNKVDFVFVNYFLWSADEDKFDVVFDALRDFRERRWSVRAAEPLEKFVHLLFVTYMDCERTDGNLVDGFLARFQEIFSPIEAFDEFVTLTAMRFKNLNAVDLSRAVVDFNKSLITTCGKCVIQLFAAQLDKLLSKFCETEADKYEFYVSLLKSKRGVDDVLLLLQLLPKTKPILADCAGFYEKVVAGLGQFEEDAVKVQLNLVLTQ